MTKQTKFLLLIFILLISMGLFNYFKSGSRFVTKEHYNQNTLKQKEMNEKTIHQLSKYGVTEASELKLEFFFYTDKQDKASNLAIELKKLNYQIDKVEKSAGDKNLWVINGWTTKLKMDIETITDWSTQMCKLGFDNDCDFDGWGTSPDQNIEVEKNLTAEQYYNKGLDYYHDKQLRKSELYFTNSIKLDSTFSISYFNRAMVRTELGNIEQALEDYNSAIKLKPDYEEAYENRGAIKDESGDYSGAILDYTEGLKVNPKSTIAYSNRGNSKYRNGDKFGACADWKKALELGDTDAQSKLDQYCK